MRRSRLWSDEGSASLELVTAGFVLLLPLVYLVLVMSAVQGGALAVEGAARQAARVFVQASDAASAEQGAIRAVEFALADHGIDPTTATISIECSRPGCLVRREFVTVTVGLSVPLPFAPTVLGGGFALSVPLEATATQQVSRFWSAG